MIELPHTIVGATIALKVGNPALALPLALGSHFILDMLPHWNPHLNSEKRETGRVSTQTTLIVALDTFLSLIAGVFIASLGLPDVGRFLTVIAASFLAVLPDVVEGPYFFLGWENSLIKKLVKLQSSIQFNVPRLPGLISQMLIIAAATWWVFWS